MGAATCASSGPRRCGAQGYSEPQAPVRQNGRFIEPTGIDRNRPHDGRFPGLKAGLPDQSSV